MTHDDGVIVAGGDPGAELLTVVGFKVLFGSDKDVGGGIEPQKLRSPLLGQVVRHYKEGFLAQTQTLTLHSGGHHFKGFARTYFVRQKRIAAIHHMGDGVQLMLPQGNGRVHAAKNNMAAVILAGAGGVHFLVVLAHQSLTALRVFPNPIFESIPDGLLLLGGQGGFFGVQDTPFLAVRILHGVVDTDITQV